MPDELEPAPLPCPRCNAPMRLVASVPATGPFPELLTFRCPGCDNVETIERKPSR